MTRILVLGGGVAGLTAADELTRRGYEVDVFDADAVPGGKARSVAPRWVGPSHRNLLDSLGGIPSGEAGDTIADHMSTSSEVTLWPGRRTLRWSDLTATRIGQLDRAVETLLNGGSSPSRPLPFGPADVAYLTHLLGVVALADRHKLLELEGHGFADYTCRVFAERSVLQPSSRLRSWLSGAGTRLFGMPRPAGTSARTGLVALLRLLNPMELYTERGDRVLPGATHDEWLRLWQADLERVSSRRPCAVRFHAGRRVDRIGLRGDRAESVVDTDGVTVDGFDHLVCALPHASLRAALGTELPAPLAGLEQLADGWLAGIRFRLRDAVDLPDGHNVHVDSPWALSSAPTGASEVAVSVADWDAVSPTLGKKARECTRAELVAEVWRQLRIDGIVEDAVVDSTVTFGPGGATSSAPVFRNTVGSWTHRPEADPGFENLFLAGDYVRTNADVPTMEAANESARRAVRALLGADGYGGPSVKISSVDHLGLLEDS